MSDQYVARLENRVKAIEGQLDERREDIVGLSERLDVLQEFSADAEARLLEGVLFGEEIVIVELPRTDGILRDALAEAIETAGGEVVSTILLTERFALEDEAARMDLAAVLTTSSTGASDLRTDAARILGQRAAGAAARVATTRGGFSTQRLASLIAGLQDGDFIDVTTDGETLVPPGAAFVVVGGAVEDPVEGTVPLSLELASALSSRGSGVLVAETTDSVWEFVPSIRDNADAGAAVSTIDSGESIPGRIAAVLGLELAIDGVTGHYGIGEGATAILPPATPDD